jgi:hypothetical protein
LELSSDDVELSANLTWEIFPTGVPVPFDSVSLSAIGEDASGTVSEVISKLVIDCVLVVSQYLSIMKQNNKKACDC